MEGKEQVLSCIQPTGNVHLGRYFGAIQNWVALQEKYDCIYGVVNYHGMTTPFDPQKLRTLTWDVAFRLMACGLDVNNIFIHSLVPEHTELAWILSCMTSYGELTRMTQFKDKSLQISESNKDAFISTGLFTYPVLQAADILLYKASRVPVGQDQEQHLELSREIARKFNARFGKVFPEARTLFTSTPKIRGLDGQAKMFKSLGNHIAVDEEEKVLRKKLASAFTDPNRQQRTDPGDPQVCNIFALHGFFSEPERVKQIDADCRSAAIGCVDCKRLLGDAIIERCAPIRDKLAALRARPDEVRDILRAGRDRCRAMAEQTMSEVRKKTGLPPGP